MTEAFLVFDVDLSSVEATVGETLESRIRRQLVQYYRHHGGKDGKVVSDMGSNLLVLLREKEDCE
jgi:hypothetical protein